jgi:hypothetical protein
VELESMRDQRAVCPHWFAAMQSIALGQHWTREDYESLFEEAVAREPEYIDYYTRKATYLLPRWHGEEGEWQAFARGLISRFPNGMGDELYARIASTHARMDYKTLDESGLDWPLVKGGFELMCVKYPNRFGSSTASPASRSGPTIARRASSCSTKSGISSTCAFGIRGTVLKRPGDGPKAGINRPVMPRRRSPRPIRECWSRPVGRLSEPALPPVVDTHACSGRNRPRLIP